MANWVADYLLRNPDMAARPIYKRAKHGIHFDLGNGEIRAEFTGKPIHFQDGGIWKPIDTKLIAKGNGFYGCPHSDVLVHPDGRVAVEGTTYAQLTTLPGTVSAGLLDNDRIVREFTGGRQFLYVTEDGFRQEIVLDRIPTLTVKEAGKLLATVSGGLPLKYVASLLTATDAAGRSYTYDNLTNLRAWLTSATYPVVIDPDFTSGSADTRVRSQYGSTFANARANGYWVNNSNASDSLGVAGSSGSWSLYRLFLLFDTSSIDDGATIAQANLKLVCTTDNSSTDFDVQIVKQDWSAYASAASGSAGADAMFDQCLSGTADDAIWRNTSGMSTNTQYTSGNLSTAWVSKTGITYYSLRASFDYNNSEPAAACNIAIAMANHGTSGYRPVLAVTYSASGIAIPVAQYYYRMLRAI